MLLKDGVRCHPKVLTAGAEAAWLWACCIDYSRQQLTDGFVPDAALPTLATCRAKVSDLVARLVAVGLLHREEGGVRVHDYLDHNDSAERVRSDREAAAARQAAHRARKASVTSQSNSPAVTGESQRDSHVTVTSPSRARVGVGVGVSVTALNGRGVGEGVQPAEVPNVEAYADAWREAAAAAGTELRLGVKPAEVQHLLTVADAYALEEFTQAARVWWRSPHTGGKNLGLFVAQLDEVLGHIRAGHAWPYRGRPVAAPAADSPPPRLPRARDVLAAQGIPLPARKVAP